MARIITVAESCVSVSKMKRAQRYFCAFCRVYAAQIFTSSKFMEMQFQYNFNSTVIALYISHNK